MMRGKRAVLLSLPGGRLRCSLAGVIVGCLDNVWESVACKSAVHLILTSSA
jgi:hypothetical protein